MTREIQHLVNGEIVKVHVTILKNFEECKEDMHSPFKNTQQVLPPDIDPNKRLNVFIKCEIYQQDRTPTLLSHRVSGESVCHEVANEFMKTQYPYGQARAIETILCNHFEMQYRYIVL